MSDLSVRVVSNITKVYPDMIKIVIYKEPKTFVSSGVGKRDSEIISEHYAPKVSSLNRTKTLVRDIVLCNKFELFCTFTFNPKHVDSFNLHSCERVLRLWFARQHDKSREKGIDFKYLAIPEQHKSGRWHFHALLSGFVGSMKPSKLFTASSRRIFNITCFRSGFTTAVHIDDLDVVSSYITKYISKDFVKLYNKRRFICSRNLERPIRKINTDYFRYSLPLFRKKVSENHEVEEYIIDKSTLVCNNYINPDVVQYRDYDLGDC